MSQAVSLEYLHALVGGDLPPIILRTSDRILFKRCRRLWGWLSHLKQGIVLREITDYLWFGSGVHYALEDYHGLNLYGHPALAFTAYVEACRKAEHLPGTWQEHLSLGVALMSYYADHWLVRRDPLRTFEVDGIPQCEVNGVIDLDVEVGGRRVLYGITLDRMIIDEYDRLWIGEYKTAKRLEPNTLDVDEQITAYCWAAWKLYRRPVAGVVYQQFRKAIPALPKILTSGLISTDARQSTSAALYSKMLTDMYGPSNKWPSGNVACYNKLVQLEDEDSDRFIVRRRIERNENQLQAFEQKVLLELEEIANPNLALYSNATKDCDFMCPLQAACIAMDDGSDWQRVLGVYGSTVADGEGLTQREKEQSKWRNLLPEPSEIQLPPEGVQYSQLLNQLEQEPSQGLEQRPEELFLEEIGLA